MIAGRSDNNDIVINDPWASRKHVVFRGEGSDVYVEDLETRQGTTLIRGGEKGI
jgi:pSer/pThr/pTyr-binding forkhead associated (FHA) protein